MAIVPDLAGNRPNNAPVTDTGTDNTGVALSGSITTGGTWQLLQAGNGERQFAIQNRSTGSLFVFDGTAAPSSTDVALEIPPTPSYYYTDIKPTANLYIYGATTGQKFWAKSEVN